MRSVRYCKTGKIERKEKQWKLRARDAHARHKDASGSKYTSTAERSILTSILKTYIAYLDRFSAFDDAKVLRKSGTAKRQN